MNIPTKILQRCGFNDPCFIQRPIDSKSAECNVSSQCSLQFVWLLYRKKHFFFLCFHCKRLQITFTVEWNQRRRREEWKKKKNCGTKIIWLLSVTMFHHPWGETVSNLHSNSDYTKDFARPSHQWTAPGKKKHRYCRLWMTRYSLFFHPHLYEIWQLNLFISFEDSCFHR